MEDDQLEGTDVKIQYFHDKEERRNLLNGKGEGLPAHPAAESIKVENFKEEEDPNKWLNSVEHSHLSDEEWEKLKNLLLTRKDAFSKTCYAIFSKMPFLIFLLSSFNQ